MTQLRSKIFVILLMAMFVGSGLIGAALILSAAPVAGCHGKSHSKSMPQSGYQCCVVGHSAALQPNMCDTFVLATAHTSVKSLIFIIYEHNIIAHSETAASPPPLLALRI